MATLRCHGADLYLESSGTGDPIVFLHGLAAGMRYFEPQLDGLSDEYRTLAVDFRGHGRSEHTALGHTVAQYADDTAAVLEETDSEDVILVGWSLGALVAWEYVDRYGTDRLRAIVDVDMEPSPFQRDDYPYGTYSLSGLREWLQRLQTEPLALLDDSIDRLCNEPPTGEMRRMMFDEMSRCPPTIQGTVMLSLLRDYREVLEDLDVPMLVCVGEDGTWRSAESVAHTAEVAPTAQIERFPDSGHCLTIEEPERFNRSVREFVDTL